ncbi:MAG: dihydroorotate dehydrogenase-like protein [Chromatiales bacterium]|jgi:dihydroorotate dehydrogenase (fumarate)
MDLSTKYLGLELKNPLVPSASPLSKDIDMARRLEDAGASALVMYSLFEEEIEDDEDLFDRTLHQDIGHGEASSYLPADLSANSHLDLYLTHLASLKDALDIPVIASLNGNTLGGWVEHAMQMEQMGADALELNVYHVAANIEESGTEVEQRYIDILTEVKKHIKIPITMKLSAQFSSPGYMVKQLQQAGADGVSLFNRFYQPDIDLETLFVGHTLNLSRSEDALLAMRWIAILYGRVDMSLAATGGIHTHEDVMKMLLAGADVCHMTAALLKHGPEHIKEVLADMHAWMEFNEYDSVEQLKGSVSQQHATQPVAYERANYISLLQSYR